MWVISAAKKVLFQKLYNGLPRCIIILLVILLLLTLNWYLLGEVGFKNYRIIRIKKANQQTLKETRNSAQAKSQNSESNYIQSSEREHSTGINTRRPNRADPKPDESSRVCPNWSLQPMNQTEYGMCTPHIPTEESCKFAHEIYQINSELSQCKTRGHGDVCEMIVGWSEGEKTVSFKCKKALCGQAKNGSFTVLGVDPKTGLMTGTPFASVEDLQNGLPGIVEQNIKENLHFVFIECKTHHGQTVSQLFPFDPRFTIKETKEIRNEDLINVNILLLDSISRAHFYRSLPKTVSTFQNWRKNEEVVPAKVFDFELFQAVHGHTAENTHALFTGKLFPVQDNGKTLPVGMAALFGPFKRARYQTMWQEDLCWEGVWGLMTDLGAGGWRDLRYKLGESFIDHTGITHSSCKILKSLGRRDPFSGPEGDQICYNGKFQHSYFLRHTIDTLRAVNTSRNARPLFSYTALNVGHDHRAIRTQTLDTDLEGYVTALAKDENTLTIILADHGNTYARYTTAVLEGRFEMFHPSLFVIVPDKVATHLGKDAMLALETNQRRLVTMIELHHSLKALAGASTSGAIKNVGLFTRVSANRTCHDVELRTPNLCVCEGWDVPAENDSSRIPLAEFAIGQLNNILQEQYDRFTPNNADKSGGARSCRRLRPLRFENVRERNSKTTGSLITSLDIHVEAGDVVPQTEDVFRIEVETKMTPAENNLEMTLLAYDRLTLFGRYKTCADDIAELKLCVCSREVSKLPSRNASSSPNERQFEYFGQPVVFKTLNNEKCLWLIERRHAKGTAFGFEVANICHSQTYRVNFDATSSNMKFSRKVPFSLDIKPQTILFAFSAGKHISYWDATVDVEATVLEL